MEPWDEPAWKDVRSRHGSAEGVALSANLRGGRWLTPLHAAQRLMPDA